MDAASLARAAHLRGARARSPRPGAAGGPEARRKARRGGALRSAPVRRAFAVPIALLVPVVVAALPSAADPAEARRGARAARAEGVVRLAGEDVKVRWTDGDTFRILSGGLRGLRARLGGVNTLEAFGPVHRIGAAGGATLLAVAKRSAAVAAAAGGPCEPRGTDRLGRLLVDCPQVAEALVRTGHAMVFAVEAPADPHLLALQSRAQRQRLGIWIGGAPRLVPTGVHSTGEPGLGPRGAYDRVVDTRTGIAAARPHARTYATCEEVCLGEGPGERACMTYVPYGRWYRDKPACIRAAKARRARR